jgi:hypothetical protein
MYKPKDLNRDWSPRFSTLRDKNGWIRAKTAGNLNLGVPRNRFCDFLADPDSRSFSRFYTNIERSRYAHLGGAKNKKARTLMVWRRRSEDSFFAMPFHATGT